MSSLFVLELAGRLPTLRCNNNHAVIYIDGPHHAYPERQARDKSQTECMEDRGYTVIRFGLEDDWGKILTKFPYVFGRAK